MTQDEMRHMNVLLEDIRHKVQLAFEGHQILHNKIDKLEQKVDQKFDILDKKIDYKFDILEQDIKEVKIEVKGIRNITSKLLDIMDEYDMRLKRVESR